MSREDQLIGLIGTWYEASTDIRKWPDALQNTCEVFGADKAQMVGFESDLTVAWLSIGYRTDQSLVPKFLELTPHDPRAHWVVANPGRPISCSLHLDRAELHASRMYRELLSRPDVDAEYTLGISELLDDSSRLSIALMRGRANAPFTQQDCDDIGHVLPHFRNAAYIIRQLEVARVTTTSIAEVLEKMLTPLVLVDQQCRVIHANRAAADLAMQGAVSLGAKTISLASAADEAMMRDAVRAVAEGPSRDDAHAQPLPTRRFSTTSSGGERLSVHVAPVRTLAGQGGDGRKLALISLLHPQGRYETAAQVIRRLYGLTHAEADVVSDLIAGDRVAAIATRRGTSKSTIQDQLKSIYRKTGADDQASLVRIVSTNPIVRSSAIAPKLPG